MTITDKQIEAAARAIALTECPGTFVTCITESGCTCRSDAIAALEAAEAAAWCDDIGRAPRDGTWILAELSGSPSVVTALGYVDGHWEDHIGAGFSDNQIKRWRHLPQPPGE